VEAANGLPCLAKEITNMSLRRWLRRKKDFEQQMAEELRFHLEKQIAANIAAGMTPAEAQRNAKLQLGAPEGLKESCREENRGYWLESLWADVRYGLRILGKSPGFTTVAVLTLALGMGANTAIFSVVNAVLLRSLPFKDAGRLVDLTEYRPRGVDQGGVSFPDYLVWKQQNTAFEQTAAYFLINASNDIVLGGPFSTERARYSTVTNSFFSILGVQPALGHGFSASDEIPGGRKVFLLSDALWHRAFGGDPHAIGKTYLLDGENFTLAGVMPPGFDFPKGCGIWVPTSTLGAWGFQDRISHPYHVLGRLRRGTSLSQAEAQIEAIQARLAKAYPATDTAWHVRARPLLYEIVGNVQTSLFVLLGAVGFILLIACTNVVSLMLARASVREKEFAIRAALGAGRRRLLQQNLAEAFIIAVVSLVLALVFAKWGLELVVSVTSMNLPRMESFHLNVPVLAFMSGLAALTTIAVGLVPALQLSRQDPQVALGDGQRSGEIGPRGQRLRGSLVVSEVAFALLLLSGAGLMLRSFVQLIRVNPGFQPDHLLTMKIALPGGAYPKVEQTSAYFDRLLGRLRALPGVQSVAAATTLPLSGESDWGTFLSRSTDWTKASAASWRGVTVDYFRTLGIPLLRGREFTPADAKNRNTVIINEAMATKFWPGADPIGQQILNRDQHDPLQIVGIVGDTKGIGLDGEPEPEMYTIPRGLWYAFLILRTGPDPARMAAGVREQVAALDRGVPVYQIATMDQLLDRSVAPQRFNLFLLGLFAALALGLAAVGIYGVLAFSVGRRTHEIGIRLALGAHQHDILRLIVAQGMKLVLLGIILGTAGAAALTRLMASLLYAVSSTDPATFIAVPVLLALVALAACYIPARRATRVDPITALRHE
jgi:putative ABC transport system permease protein